MGDLLVNDKLIESLTIMEKGSTSSTHGSSLKQPPTGTTAVQKQTNKQIYKNLFCQCWSLLLSNFERCLPKPAGSVA